jgi:phosphatidylglycerophosphatase A
VGLLLYWPLHRLPLPWQIATLGLVFGAGVLCCSRVVRQLGDPDPGVVVVDEVVGMWASLIWLPFTLGTALAGFVIFRIMDIFKPYPARDLESLHGGWGIMADDLMAGIYANLLLRVALRVWPAS